MPCGGSPRLRGAGGGQRRVRSSFVRLRGGPLAGPGVSGFTEASHCHHKALLLLWALLPRAARRDALAAEHRFLADSRALLGGEEAGGGGAATAGGRGRSRAANGSLERAEPGARPGPSRSLPAHSSRVAGAWRGRGSESGAREPSGSR